MTDEANEVAEPNYFVELKPFNSNGNAPFYIAVQTVNTSNSTVSQYRVAPPVSFDHIKFAHLIGSVEFTCFGKMRPVGLFTARICRASASSP